MDVYVIRHADAVPVGERGISDDEQRPLSGVGLEQAKTLGTVLQKKGITLGGVVSSPLLRARQTAEAVVKAWTPPPELMICDELAPGGRPKRIAKFLRNRDLEKVAVVGHEPDLGEFAGWLIGDKKVHIDLAKGGVAYISCDGEPRKGSGTLIWLVSGDWLGYSPAVASTA